MFSLLSTSVILVAALVLIPTVLLVLNGIWNFKSKSSLRVLVADDDEISIAPLLAALAHRSSEIYFVKNGQLALKAMQERHFDLIFLDLMMPDLSGDSVLRLYATNLSSKKSIPVIFYTSYQTKARVLLEEKFQNFIVDDVWFKPMPYKLLDQKLEELFFQAS